VPKRLGVVHAYQGSYFPSMIVTFCEDYRDDRK
jgi:hypothetical protein